MRSVFVLSSIAAAVLLAACGGGGGGSTSATEPPSIGGTAAVGAPIVGAVVNVKCAGGPQVSTVQTGSNGDWTAVVTGNTLPCAVQVSGGMIRGAANTEKYHTLAAAVGRVNITPLTDLMVANAMSAANTQTWFNALPAKDAQAVAVATQATLDAALTKMRAALPTLSSLATINPITVTFNPVAGDVTDNMLEAFRTALLTSNTTHSALLANASLPGFTAPSAAFLSAVTAAQNAQNAANTLPASGSSGATGDYQIPGVTAILSYKSMSMVSNGNMRVDFSEANNETQAYDFIDMTSGYFELTSNRINSQICLKALPATIPVNKAGLPAYVQEYAWITEIDSNGDGRGDFLLQTTVYKNEQQQSEKALTQIAENGLWRVVSSSNEIINSPVDFSVSNNCLNLSVQRSAATQAVTGYARIRMYAQAVTVDNQVLKMNQDKFVVN